MLAVRRKENPQKIAHCVVVERVEGFDVGFRPLTRPRLGIAGFLLGVSCFCLDFAAKDLGKSAVGEPGFQQGVESVAHRLADKGVLFLDDLMRQEQQGGWDGNPIRRRRVEWQ